MRLSSAIIFFVAAFIIQSTILKYLSIFNMTPNILLSLIIVFAFVGDEPYIIALSGVFGILWDLCFGIYVGVSGISFVITVMLMMLLKLYLNNENTIAVFFAGIIGYLANAIIFWGIYLILQVSYGFTYIARNQWIPLMLNSICVIIIYFLFKKILAKGKNENIY